MQSRNSCGTSSAEISCPPCPNQRPFCHVYVAIPVAPSWEKDRVGLIRTTSIRVVARSISRTWTGSRCAISEPLDVADERLRGGEGRRPRELRIRPRGPGVRERNQRRVDRIAVPLPARVVRAGDWGAADDAEALQPAPEIEAQERERDAARDIGVVRAGIRACRKRHEDFPADAPRRRDEFLSNRIGEF